MGILITLAVTLDAAALGAGAGPQLPFVILVPEANWAVAYSPDGKVVASCGSGNERSVQLWSVATGKKVAALEGHTPAVHSLAFSPDGKLLAASDGADTIRLWDVSTKQVVKKFESIPNSPCKLVFDRKGKTLAAGGFRGSLQLWDIETGKPTATLKGETDFADAIFALAFSADGKTIASGSDDKSLRLWDVATGKEQRVLKHPAEVIAVAFTPDGKALLSGDTDGTVRRWSLATFETDSVRLKHSSMGFGAMTFSPDGRWCATGEFWFGKEDEGKAAGVAVWDVATGKEVARFAGHKTKVLGLMFSPDGKKIASVGGDTELRIETIPQQPDK